MTIANIAKMCGISASTVKRRLAKVPERWRQPTIQGGSGFVHIDATYYSQKEGLLVALEANSGRLLYAKQIGPERAADYTEAIEDVRARSRGLYSMATRACLAHSQTCRGRCALCT